MQAPSNDLVTVNQVRVMLGNVSRRWVYYLIARGDLPVPFQVPHREHAERVRFHRNDIERYLAKRDEYAVDQNQAA